MEAKFKIEDKLRCKPGFNTDSGCRNNFSGGAGYRENLIITVSKITEYNGDNNVYWYKENTSGIFEQALELVNQNKIIKIW